MSTFLGANPLEFVTNESSLLDINSVIVSEESSYLSETLKFIQECNREFNEANKGWYKNILESGNDQTVITESFHDFFVKVKGIIDKFIAYIKSLADRFITNLMSLSKSDNYLVKHREDLKKFIDSKDEFEFEGYEFTFDPAVPKTEMVQAGFTQEFIELKMSQDGNVVDAAGAASAMKKVYDELIHKLENGFYDEFRKTVLSVGSDISQSDFANECFSVFRNNTSDKENITVNSTYVNSAYLRFTNYSDMKKDAEKVKTRIVREYEAVKKQILDISKTTYTGKTSTANINLPDNQLQAVTLSTDSMKYLDLYVKAKADQVQEMSNIHAIAFACKLDAMKASFVQDKTVLYKALSKSQRVHEANYIDYTKEFEYATFLMESLENQRSMERYIKECCILSEGVDIFERIQALNEGKIGDKFKKFVEWIKGIIAKFIEKLNGLVAKDKTYLDKYKDIILGKKFKIDADMPEYFEGLKRINKTTVPELKYESQVNLLAGENQEFAQSIISDVKYDPTKFDSFSDFCKGYFQGSREARKFPAAELTTNVKDMFDFCYDNKTIVQKINNDLTVIDRAAKWAEGELSKISKENEDNRNSSVATKESRTYSAVYGRYITEGEADEKGKLASASVSKSEEKPADSSNAANDSKKLSSNIQNTEYEKDDKGNSVAKITDRDEKIAASQDITTISKNIKAYNDACSDVLTAKLTICEKIRSDFMKIIRAHVASYVGKADDRGDNNSSKPEGSDYRLTKDQEAVVKSKVKEYTKASPEDKKTIASQTAKQTGAPEEDIRNALDYYLNKTAKEINI